MNTGADTSSSSINVQILLICNKCDRWAGKRSLTLQNVLEVAPSPPLLPHLAPDKNR